MPVHVKWNDVAPNESGHQVLRKHVDDADFTVVHQITAPAQTAATGIVEWTDNDELASGDYVYKIRNYTNSGLEKFSEEQIVTLIDVDNHKVCMALNDTTFVDGYRSLFLVNDVNMTTADDLSGANFNNSYIEMTGTVDLTDQFTISVDIHPSSTMSSAGTILKHGDDYQMSVTLDKKIQFQYKSGDGQTQTLLSSQPIATDQYSSVFISANSADGTIIFYVDGQQHTTHAFTDTQTSQSNTVLIGSDGASDTFQGYIKDLSIVTGQNVHYTSCTVCSLGAQQIYFWMDSRVWNDDETWTQDPNEQSEEEYLL